jgi:prephenate dehydratase
LQLAKYFQLVTTGPYTMNISSRALLAVLSALSLTGIAFAGDLVFLGPRGSYSEEAASQYVSRAHLDTTIPLTTITEIAQSVGEGREQFGLLPFENSTGGFVGETHKLLLASQDPGWRVVGDVTVSISNNLLVKPGTRASDLRKIISHPEALKECANWLKTKFPQLGQESMSSTAAAAEAVSKGDGTIAAIASPAAARVYGLQILF